MLTKGIWTFISKETTYIPEIKVRFYYVFAFFRDILKCHEYYHLLYHQEHIFVSGSGTAILDVIKISKPIFSTTVAYSFSTFSHVFSLCDFHQQLHSYPFYSFLMTVWVNFNTVHSYLSSKCCNLSLLNLLLCESCNLLQKKKPLVLPYGRIFHVLPTVEYSFSQKKWNGSSFILVFASPENQEGIMWIFLWVIQTAYCIKQGSILCQHFSSEFNKTFLLKYMLLSSFYSCYNLLCSKIHSSLQ